MARKARKYQLSSLISHAINRGIFKQEIFHDEEDFQSFMAILQRFRR